MVAPGFHKVLWVRGFQAIAWSSIIIAERLDDGGGLSQENLTAPDPSQVLSDLTQGLLKSPSDQGALFFSHHVTTCQFVV